MKKINKLFILLFLYSLTGCNDTVGDSPVPFYPEVIILYTDTDGKMLERTNSSNFEILSVEDSEGNFPEYRRFNPATFSEYTCLDMGINELFTNQSPKTERHYTVRYKVTLHSDKEREEELKLTFIKNVWGTFTEAWYNGNPMKKKSIAGFFDGPFSAAGFDGTFPVAVMIADANLVYLLIPVE
jgi:hypothetical protein